MDKPSISTTLNQDEFATYAAPVLLQMAGMARRLKKDFASYLLEMAAAELVEQKSKQNH